MIYDIGNLKVLLVGDNPSMLMLMRTVLLGLRIKDVQECTNPAEALRELRHFTADLVFVDLMMQPIDGVEFTKLIRTSAASPNPAVPIIMLIGRSEERRMKHARDAGVSAFLNKPISAKVVYSRVISLMEHARPMIRSARYSGPDRRWKPEERANDERRKDESQTLDSPPDTDLPQNQPEAFMQQFRGSAHNIKS